MTASSTMSTTTISTTTTTATTTATATSTATSTPTPDTPWQAVAARKKAEQLARIPAAWRLTPEMLPGDEVQDVRGVAAACGVLSGRELRITGAAYDATGLAAAVAAGTFTATETVTAFCKRAAVAQQVVNCLTEIRFAAAVARAAELDAVFRATGRPVGPLHGLALTVKECFHVAGLDASNGYVSRCFAPSTTTTPAVAACEAAGAVVIAKTNVPQTMLVCHTDNNVFGETRNPRHVGMTPGGSSGGEGALCAFGGTSLGVGTDVGGSIRLPAAYNGVYGYRPSAGVLPFIGYAPSGWAGVNSGITAVLGPIARSARDLRLFADVLRASEPWKYDPAVLHTLPPPPSQKRPVVGFLHASGLTPHPPVRRALRQAAAALAAAGYDVRDFTPACPDLLAVRDVSTGLLTQDGLSYQRRQLALAGEPPVPSVRSFGFWDQPPLSHEQVWALGARKAALQKQMLDAWQALGIDVLVAPAAANPPARAQDVTLDLYTVVWNVMDYPSVIVPYTTVDRIVDAPDEPFTPLHALDAETHALYDADAMHGLPVALQLVAPRLQDNALLAYAEELDAVLNGGKSVLE